MKFDCGIEQLLSAVSLANRFIERKANLPVLGSIFIAAEGSRLLLRATNLECGVEVSVTAKISRWGVVAVPGATLLGFLGNARGKSISGEVSGGVIKLKTERASAAIKTTPHEDFPILPHVSASASFSVKTSELAR